MGKAHRNALAQTADAHHQLSLVVEALGPVGHKKRLAVLQQG